MFFLASHGKSHSTIVSNTFKSERWSEEPVSVMRQVQDGHGSFQDLRLIALLSQLSKEPGQGLLLSGDFFFFFGAGGVCLFGFWFFCF